MSLVTVLKTDFLVVGAGIIGLSTAWELARSGASVVVVDRGLAGRESSWAGGGMLFPLWPWDYADAVTALTDRGRALYPDWVGELWQASGIDPEYRQTGLVALPPADFDRARAWCATRGLRAELVPGKEIAPALASHQKTLWLPDAAQVRNPRLLRALTVALGARSVPVLENVVVREIALEGMRATGVITDRGPMSAGAVVVCAGAWSKVLLGECSEGADIFPVRGQMLLYRAPAGILPAMVLQGDNYLIPRMDGHILAGSTSEYTGFEKRPTAEAASELHLAAMRTLPALNDLRPIMHWAGLRPGSPGNVPVIARHPGIDDLYLNAGHFRYGITMAPAAAKILASLALGAPHLPDVTSYGWPRASAQATVDVD